FLVTIDSYLISSGLYESTDGKNWNFLFQDAPSQIQYDRLRQLFVGIASDGRFARSIDGVTWEYFTVSETQNTLYIIPNGSVLVALQNMNSSEFAISTDAGETWTAGTAPDPDAQILDYVAIDGSVVIFTSKYDNQWIYTCYTSIDGINWTRSENVPEGHLTSGNLTLGLGGLVFINSEGDLYTSADGSSWAFIERIDDALSVSQVGDHFFLTGAQLRLYSPIDWVNRSLSVTPGDYGIEDAIELDFEIYNASLEGSVPEPFEIEFRLSKDRYWDAGDLPLGTATVDTALPVPGMSNQWTVEGQLPENINGGSYFVLSQINPGYSSPEKYYFNNFKHTTLADVVVPEWVLNVSMSGNGATQLDNNSIRYASNSQINLVALENKRSVFNGWTGDTPGGLNMLTLIMDEDKDLTASFTNYNLLILEARGGGTVVSTTSRDQHLASETVGVTAVPEEGWSFVRWSGDHTGSNPEVVLSMSTDQNLVAHFGQTYAQWQALEFAGTTGKDQTTGGDPDDDKLLNIQEYLSGSDPLIPDDEGEVLYTDFTSTSILLRYWAKRGELDGQVRVLATEDLSSDWQVLETHTRILENESAAQYIEVEIPFDEADSRFIKLDYSLSN
ncbi:MAG: InlB B-repeat-containing protein, partial [Opitutales bacterium]